MKQKLCAVCLVLCVFAAGCGLAQQPEEDIYSGQDAFTDDILKYRKENNKDFVRAAWVSYLDIVPMMSENKDTFSANVDSMLDNLETIAVTDIYFQVRAFGDSIYPSSVYPSASETLYPMSDAFDYLEIVINKTHARGMRLHAWINPYRLHSSSDETYQAFIDGLVALEEGSVERLDSGRTLNPASETAQSLVLAGVQELLNRYQIDGVHYDDYFYPTTDTAFDASYYAAYQNGGGTLALDAWRRDNVTKLIQETYDMVKAKSNQIEFGISPDGSIERNQTTHYLDVELFCTTAGYIDYICPQLYYGYDNESMPFLPAVTAWAELARQCKLIVGLCFYKVGTQDSYAGAGSDEWLESFDIISRQYLDSLEITNCNGVAFYRYDSIFNPDADAASYVQLELYNLQQIL